MRWSRRVRAQALALAQVLVLVRAQVRLIPRLQSHPRRTPRALHRSARNASISAFVGTQSQAFSSGSIY